MSDTVILFQGDSITDGNRLKGKENAWDLNHQMGHDYAYIINARLEADHPTAGLRFINRGISGHRIADLYGRWQEDAVNLKPDVLSVLVGINDVGSTVWDQAGSSPDRFEKIYQLMLDEIRDVKPDALLVLMEPFLMPVGPRKDDFDQWMSLMKPLQEKTRLVAEKNHAVFIPLQDRFNALAEMTEASQWVWDGVHPTVCGHQIIADEWMKAVVPLLKL